MPGTEMALSRLVEDPGLACDRLNDRFARVDHDD